MQRTQSGHERGDSSVGSSKRRGKPGYEPHPRSLVEALDDALDEQQNLRAALTFLEYFKPEADELDATCLLCERGAMVLANTGRAGEAARVWQMTAKYWAHTGQAGRAIAAILQIQRLGAFFDGLLDAFSALYNIRSPYLSQTARVRAVAPPRTVPNPAVIEARLEQLALSGAERAASSAAQDGLLTRVFTHTMSVEGAMLEMKAREGSLPPMSLLSLLPAPALRRVLEFMSLNSVARGDTPLTSGESPAGLFWTINQDFCIEPNAPHPDEGQPSTPVGLRIPSGALLGLNSFGPSAEPARHTVTSCSNGGILFLSRRAIDALDQEFGDFLNRLTTLRRHALSEGFLENHRLFLQVERAQRADLMRRFCGVRVSEGEVLIEQGGASAGIYLVLDGQVDVIRSAHGKQHTVETLRAGEVFGAVSVVSNRRALARFVMATAGHVLFLSTEKFGQAAAEMPGIAKFAVKLANRRIETVEALLEDVAPAPLEGA